MKNDFETCRKEALKAALFREVVERESQLMRECPSITGGKKSGETVEQYAGRCLDRITGALNLLTAARHNLKTHG